MKQHRGLTSLTSLEEFHRVFGLPKLQHPLISLVKLGDVRNTGQLSKSFVLDFYQIAYKNEVTAQVKYGQQHYDFGEGGLVFTAPRQRFDTPKHRPDRDYLLLIHPDFLLGYPLAATIKSYAFFAYTTNESLHLSANERQTVVDLLEVIQRELAGRTDVSSQDVLIAQLELLLAYCNRFYRRQFMNRKMVHDVLLVQLEGLLEEYFTGDQLTRLGIPTVQYLADHLHVSPGYLSDILRSLTGLNAQQHIHLRLIEKAKALLSTSDSSIGDIAYALGFEHSQSFSKLFKQKTELSPSTFRRSFN